jgi:uncharacterized protein (TIGR03083 family)
MVHVQTAGQIVAVSNHDGARIPALTHREAMAMTAEELRRFQALIEALSGTDWDQPTACTLWTVKDIVAHQAAHITSFASRKNFFGQLSPSLMWPYLKKGLSGLDAWNQSQVDLRRDKTPAQVIAEIREAAPASLKGRDRIPGFLHWFALPVPGFDQPRSFGYLFDLIYTRDMWMHRIDICRAAGLNMALDAAHDGRTVALIVRDLAMKCKRGLNGRAAILELTGAAGGRYHIGGSATPSATIQIDALDFSVLASGRDKAASVLANRQATISGDGVLGRDVVNFIENRVLF